MRIGIFADRIGTEGGGLETYELGLIRGLMEIDNGNSYAIYGSCKHTLAESLSAHPKFTLTEVSKKSKLLRFSLGLPYKLMKDNIDVLHICMVPPLLCPQKYVLTAHDMAPFTRPEFFPRMIRLRARIFLKAGINNAERIIAVSEATKADIVKLFGVDPDRIAVVHLGVDTSYRPLRKREQVAAILKKYGVPDKYILYVGKIQARKNIRRLVQAFHVLKTRKNVGHKLVLVGKTMWESDGVFEEIEKLGIEDEVLYLGHIDYSDLPYIYNGADVFAFPSLFEGFGLPPLEAMACGVPVVTSNTTSIPEVVGDAALMVDPYSVEEIADKIFLLLENEQVRKELIEKGYARAALYSWAVTAEKTLQLYKEVYSQHYG